MSYYLNLLASSEERRSSVEEKEKSSDTSVCCEDSKELENLSLRYLAGEKRETGREQGMDRGERDEGREGEGRRQAGKN